MILVLFLIGKYCSNECGARNNAPVDNPPVVPILLWLELSIKCTKKYVENSFINNEKTSQKQKYPKIVLKCIFFFFI